MTPRAGLITPLYRSDWTTCRLKFLFQRQNRLLRDDDEVVTAFRDGTVTLRSNRREDGFTFAEKEIGYQGVEPGDLVIHAMDGFAGAIGISDSRGKCSPVYTIAVPRRESSVVPQFWAYYLRNLAVTGFIQSLAKGIRERSTDFRWKDAGNLLVNFPEYQTQKSIADFLDRETARIDQLIEKKQRLIELLRERELNNLIQLFARLFQENSSWKIAHVCALRRGRFNHRPRNAPELYGGEHPFLQTGDVAQATKYIRTYKQTLTDLGASVSAKFPKGTVLMAIAANVGDVAISEFDTYCPDSIVGFIPSKRLDNVFLYYGLRSLRPSIATSSTSNAQDNTNIARLGKLKIPLPSWEVQRQVVDNLERSELRGQMLEHAASISIERLHEFRSTLITAAVTGQIDVATWGGKGQTDRYLEQIEE